MCGEEVIVKGEVLFGLAEHGIEIVLGPQDVAILIPWVEDDVVELEEGQTRQEQEKVGAVLIDEPGNQRRPVRRR